MATSSEDLDLCGPEIISLSVEPPCWRARDVGRGIIGQSPRHSQDCLFNLFDDRARVEPVGKHHDTGFVGRKVTRLRDEAFRHPLESRGLFDYAACSHFRGADVPILIDIKTIEIRLRRCSVLHKCDFPILVAIHPREEPHHIDIGGAR